MYQKLRYSSSYLSCKMSHHTDMWGSRNTA